VDCAGQSIEEAGRVQSQYIGEVISVTEEAIQAAAEMGADAKKSTELLEWARSDQQSGNYDGALEKAQQSADEAERAQYDFVRGPIEYIRKVMREAKVADDRIKRLVASAEQLLEKKEYAQARREVLRGLELTGAIQEKQARKHIFDAEEVLAEAEKTGARSTLARNFIGSALKALDARDFERAQSYAGECSTQARKTIAEFQAAQKALKAAQEETAALKDISLAPEEVTDLLELAQTDFSGGEYAKSRDFAQKAVEMAEQAYVKAAGEALSSSQFKINYAKNIGADVSEADGILKQAKAAFESKDYRKAIELARRCREEADLAKEHYKELVDTIYSAESKISVAHTYGLDTSAAEKLLAQAVANKSRNGEEALDFARQSMEEVQRALERFSPDIKVDIKLEGILQKLKWSQASLTVTNAGKATAKDVWIHFSGELEVQGSERVPILRMGESRKLAVRVRPSKGGDLPLGMSAVCLREFDSREFKSQETRWIRVEDVTPLATPLNQFVTKSVRCHICLGTIKSGLPLVRCECGKTYHETCSSRVGECPNCGRDLRNPARPQER
jgi:tetratricopeptide (TPR) repeat protein